MPPQKNKFWVHKTAEVQKGAKIGNGTKIWQNCQVLKGTQIGKNCIIGHNCLIYPKAKIGDGVKLESNIDVWDLITLQDYVFVGPSVVFTNDKNPRAKYPKSKYPKYGRWLSTVTKEGATIGANATIVCGNTIGRWAMIGAGSVVTKEIPDYAVAVGVPAKVVGWVCECGNKLEFENSTSIKTTEGKEKAACRICKRKYSKKDTKVHQLK